MEKLLNKKLSLVNELKSFTKDIMEISVKTEYAKVDSMLEERQNYIEKINVISKQINECHNVACNGKEIQKLKYEIREVLKEIYEMDNSIRKNINNELLNVKNILSQPQASSKGLNLKA